MRQPCWSTPRTDMRSLHIARPLPSQSRIVVACEGFAVQLRHDDRQRVMTVRLLRLRCRQHPNPRRQRRRHVHHYLAGTDELPREEITKSARRLDRPNALLELGCPAEQLLELTRT